MKKINFEKTTLSNLERKDLILALVTINDCFQFSNVDNNTIKISSSDGYQLTLNFKDEDGDSFTTLKNIIEYVYNYRHYICKNISNDEDALECVFKFANALILDINHEGENNVSIQKSSPTPTQLSIFRRLLAIEKISCDVFGKNQDMYSATLISRYIAESIQQAQLFIHSLDLLDYIRIIDTFSCIIPSHDCNWVDFATQMLDLSHETA